MVWAFEVVKDFGLFDYHAADKDIVEGVIVFADAADDGGAQAVIFFEGSFREACFFKWGLKEAVLAFWPGVKVAGKKDGSWVGVDHVKKGINLLFKGAQGNKVYAVDIDDH